MKPLFKEHGMIFCPDYLIGHIFSLLYLQKQKFHKMQKLLSALSYTRSMVWMIIVLLQGVHKFHGIQISRFWSFVLIPKFSTFRLSCILSRILRSIPSQHYVHISRAPPSSRLAVLTRAHTYPEPHSVLSVTLDMLVTT